MKKIDSFFAICCLSIAVLASCDTSSVIDDDIATIEQIQSVLERDLVTFNSAPLPAEVFENLKQHKVIIVGEFHTILEEREFVASLAIRLNQLKGYTEVCAECPDAYSWVFESISIGELENLPGDISYNKILPILDSLVTYNTNKNKSVKLKCVDANMQPDFFLYSLKEFSHYLNDSTDLIIVYDSLINSSITNYKGTLNHYYNILINSPSELGLTSENENTDRLIRMFANELVSIDIREQWDSDYSVAFNKRETLIKDNAEYHLSNNDGTAIFYFGMNHAQKKRFVGSDIEWLGDYLHNRSPIASGKTISIVGVPLSGEISNGNGQGTFHFDLLSQSKSNDLFRLVGERTNGGFSWLSLSDNLFIEKKVNVKYIYDDYEIAAPVGLQFDAFYIFPVGTYAGW